MDCCYYCMHGFLEWGPDPDSALELHCLLDDEMMKLLYDKHLSDCLFFDFRTIPLEIVDLQ